MSDSFAAYSQGLDSPALHAQAINLAGDTDLTATNPSRSIYVGGTGDVKVDTLGGETGVIFKAVPVGTILPVRATKIYSTANGTTATNLISMY